MYIRATACIAHHPQSVRDFAVWTDAYTIRVRKFFFWPVELSI